MKILIIGVLVLLLVGGVCFYSDNSYQEIKSPNYYSLVELGLAPNSQSRQPIEGDIDTGIKLTNGNNVYALLESRNWETLDYGKTFVVRIA